MQLLFWLFHQCLWQSCKDSDPSTDALSGCYCHNGWRPEHLAWIFYSPATFCSIVLCSKSKYCSLGQFPMVRQTYDGLCVLFDSRLIFSLLEQLISFSFDFLS